MKDLSDLRIKQEVEERVVKKCCSMCSLKLLVSWGVFARLTMLVIGLYLDEKLFVQYTDIDYKVFSDSAYHVYHGRSPYERLTYRYTPLLAYLLLPNIFLSYHFGKILFICADILLVIFIYNILHFQNLPNTRSLALISFWLFNPLAINISTRGSADSLITVLVLLSLIFILKRRVFLAGIIYGLAVHFRIYPVIYSITLYFFIDSPFIPSDPSKPLKTIQFKKLFHNFFTKQRLIFTASSLGTFILLLLIFYWIYGYEFIYSTYLYHLIRKDNRHNFSVYYYILYLSFSNKLSTLVGLLAFIPQWALIAFTGVLFHFDLMFAILIQTLIFVVFNKVCTAQYFVWYMCLYPCALYNNRLFKDKKLIFVILALLWTASEIFWNFNAYELEFQGINTFSRIWVAGVFFFFINAIILLAFIYYQEFSYTMGISHFQLKNQKESKKEEKDHPKNNLAKEKKS
jgi:GPI mannosyltransferase 1 subunit M